MAKFDTETDLNNTLLKFIHVFHFHLLDYTKIIYTNLECASPKGISCLK